MNDRIKELMRGAIADALMQPDRDGDMDKMYIPGLFAENFAELIVQECAQVVEEARWMVPPSQEQIARSIKRHFGVE